MKSAQLVSGKITANVFSSHRETVIALAGTLLYGILVGYTAHFHEPWVDEAQGWLLVRDLGLWDLLAHYLRYEGHPSLWYLVLWLPVRLGMPYQWLPVLPVAIAVFTAWLVFRYAPFPPFITWMIPFGFYFVYQYAVIARSYVLLPLLLSSLAVLYRKRLQHPVVFLVLITLLMHVSLHGTVIAVGLGLAEFANATWWPESDVSRHRWFSRWFLIVLAINSIILTAQLSFPDGLILATGLVKKDIFQMFNYSMTGIPEFSLFFWLILCLWLARKKALMIYFFPLAGLLVLFSQVYKIWHEGILFLLLIFALWVSYPPREDGEPAEKHGTDWFRVAALTAFACILSLHLIWGIRAIRYEHQQVFSGAESCAAALKKRGLDDGSLYMVGYNAIGVQPFFDRNIFVNNATPGNAGFWFWSVANPGALSMANLNDATAVDNLIAKSPRYVLVGVGDAWSRRVLKNILKKTPYVVESAFRGTTGWKGDPYEEDDLFLLERCQ